MNGTVGHNEQDFFKEKYLEFLKNFYDTSELIRSKIKKFDNAQNLIKIEIENTYDKFIKDNIFYLYHYFGKMKKTSKNIVEPVEYNEEFIRVISKINVCHYTSLPALRSIVENQTLKLNSLSNMNDSHEGKIMLDFVKKICFDKLSPDVAQQKIEEIIDKINNNVFSFSLTTEYDDAAQWDRYSNKDTGVCLVTTIGKMSSLRTIPNTNVTFNPVLYVSFRDKRYADYDWIFGQILKITDDETIESDKWPSRCAYLKDFSFKNEKELRLTVELESNNNDSVFYKVHYTDYLTGYIYLDLKQYFQTNQKQITPNSNNFFEMFFDEVMIGPQANISESNLKDFLKRNNINNINVTKSCSHLLR